MVPVPAFLGNIGWQEMLVILVFILLFFGPKRLPEVAEAFGKSIRKFKSATQDATREVRRELEDAGNGRPTDAPPPGNGKPEGPAQP
ncbi:MAG: twin-arginine translocase TatA/TatE family subunit [bacterium]|nr:twin-arginine translocase TatA/TatE family subunit [bacterium]